MSRRRSWDEAKARGRAAFSGDDWDSLDNGVLHDVLQHCYVTPDLVDVGDDASDEAVVSWYERGEQFAFAQARRFDERSLSVEDALGLDNDVSHNGVTRLLWAWGDALAWNDLGQHFWSASGESSDDFWENERFWLLLHWKALALRDHYKELEESVSVERHRV